MHELPFTLTQDLVTALVEVTGVEPTTAEPVVVLAAFIDALAKEYGLSESLQLDVDPVERTQLIAPAMDLVNHFFAPDSRELDADALRKHLYEVFVILAADPQARRVLNKNQSLTERKLLHVAQIYWNVEATAQRPKLPIRHSDGRDIPVPGISKDFATMTWTARVNEKGTYKSSGQSFRTQGARLCVLVAQHITLHAPPAPVATAAEMDVHQTNNPSEPLEITLKGLVEAALTEGNFADADELASSYLSIIKRRAEADPLELESDLAEAYLMKGAVAVLKDVRWRSVLIGDKGLEELERAGKSYAVLSELDPSNLQHREHLLISQLGLAETYLRIERLDEAAEAAMYAVVISEKMIGAHTGEDGALSWPLSVFGSLSVLARVLGKAGRFDEALEAIGAAVKICEQLVADDSTEPDHQKSLAYMLSGLSQAQCRAGYLDQAVGTAERAVAASERLVATYPEDPAYVAFLSSMLVGLSQALSEARRFAEAVEVSKRSVALKERLVKAEPKNFEYRENLAVDLGFCLGRNLREAGQLDEAIQVGWRSVAVCESLVATGNGPRANELFLAGMLTHLSESLTEAGRMEEAEAVEDRIKDLREGHELG